jgi:hypothetical protein
LLFDKGLIYLRSKNMQCGSGLRVGTCAVPGSFVGPGSLSYTY